MLSYAFWLLFTQISRHKSQTVALWMQPHDLKNLQCKETFRKVINHLF